MSGNHGSVKFNSTIIENSPIYTYDFRWEINDISKLPDNEEMDSPEFSPFSGQKWHASITKDLHLRMTILKWKSEILNMYVRFQSSFANSNDVEVYKQKKFLLFNNDGAKQSISYSFNLSNLLKNKVNIHILSEILEIDIQTNNEYLDLGFTRSEKITNKLVEDLKTMFENSAGTDVTFVVQDKQLKAHKNILRARSGVFNRMFEHESGDIKIDDLTISALNNLLIFVYSGYHKDYNYDLAYELYYASDKYEILDLREICADILVGKQDEKNFYDLINLAERHQDYRFKKKLLSFAKEKLPHMFTLKEWKEFVCKEAMLASEIVAFVSGGAVSFSSKDSRLPTKLSDNISLRSSY